MRSNEFALALLLINLYISLIIGGQHTYFYVQQHLRALSGHLTTIPAQSNWNAHSLAMRMKCVA